jgi:hypothetical protein
MTNATTLQDRFARTGIVRNERDKAEARRNRRKSGRPASPADVRECEINKVIDHVFGASLPDDDYGREVLYELLNQLALRGASPDEMRDLALDLLPELNDDDDSLDILIKGIGKGRNRRSDQVARALGITYEMRTLLDLRTIGACDMSKKERDAIQRQKEAADKRWQREQAGAKPQANSAAKTKPWLESGCSRSTYYRRQKAASENAKNSPCDHFGDHTLSIFPTDKSVSGDPPAGPCRGATDAGVEHGGEPSDFIAKPLRPLQPEPESVVSEVPETFGAVLSGRDLATAPLPFCFRVRQLCVEGGIAEAISQNVARRRLQAVASAVARSPDPQRWQHLIVAASGAWTRAKLLKGVRCDERSKTKEAKMSEAVTIERLERGLAVLAYIISLDGPKAASLFEKLERELAAMRCFIKKTRARNRLNARLVSSITKHDVTPQAMARLAVRHGLMDLDR